MEDTVIRNEIIKNDARTYSSLVSLKALESKRVRRLTGCMT